jgi:glycosyltransferase involved in cell wall biosynthesis
MRGFWADERIDGGIWKKDNLLHKAFYSYFKKKEKKFVLNANAIVSLTHAGAEVLCERFGSDFITKKINIIPCCTNTDLFQKKSTNHHDFSVTGISKEDHVLIYTGSIGTWYYTKEMIDCVLEWQKQIPLIKLLIVTKDKNALDEILKNYTSSQQELIVSASSSYSEMPLYLSIAKAAIFFIKPAYSKIASSPTKMAECWAMDLPIITNAGIGDNDLYFNQHHGGILINDFNNASYNQALDNYLELSKQSKNYRDIALNYFDSKMAIEKYTKIYDSLAK